MSLVIILGILCFSSESSAVEIFLGESSIGIGFTEPIQKPSLPKNDPIDVVLPMTNTASRPISYRYARGKYLPQTGDRSSRTMQIWGYLCLATVFWVFLFCQLREEDEEEHDEKNSLSL